MGLSLLNTIKNAFSDQVVRQVADHVGESERKVERGVKAAVPAILRGMATHAETDEGLHALQTELDKSDLGIIDNFGRRFGETPNIMVENGRKLMNTLLGAEGSKDAARQVSSAAGVGNVSAEILTGAVAPVVTGALAKHRQTAGLSTAGLRACLETQWKETTKGAAAGSAVSHVTEPQLAVHGWSSILFPLLALLGLIVLGVSLFGGQRDVRDTNPSAENSKIVAESLMNEESNAHEDADIAARQTATTPAAHGTKTDDVTGVSHGNGETDTGDATATTAMTARSKKQTANDVAKVTAAKVAGKANAANEAAHTTTEKVADEINAASEDANANAAASSLKDTISNTAKSAGKTANDVVKGSAVKVANKSNAASEAAHSVNKAAVERVADKTNVASADAHAAAVGAKNAAKKTASNQSDSIGGDPDVAVLLPAAVSTATRLLGSIRDAKGARKAVPDLNRITNRLIALRGEQQRWPEATQSKVRKRMFELMPSLNRAVGKMIESEECRQILDEPLTKFVGELDRLVPEE